MSEELDPKITERDVEFGKAIMEGVAEALKQEVLPLFAALAMPMRALMKQPGFDRSAFDREIKRSLTRFEPDSTAYELLATFLDQPNPER